MTSYVCSNCGFRADSVKEKKCPYCDKNIMEKEKTAEELVEEVEIG